MQNVEIDESDVKKGKGTWTPYEYFLFPDWVTWRWQLFGADSVLSHKVVNRRELGSGILFPSLMALLLVISFIMGVTGNIHGSGSLAVFPVLLSFTLVSHQSVFTFLLGIPVDRQYIHYHVYVGWVAVSCGMFHWLATILKKDGETDGTGMWFQISLIAMLMTSFWEIRRRWFELFYYSHILISFSVMGGAVSHYGSSPLVMLGASLWLLDLAIRYLYQALMKNPTKVSVRALPADIIRLQFPKGDFQYRAGQYVWICIPQLSLFEWHPFSISSHPAQQTVLVHVRVLGNWTSRLFELSSHSDTLTVYMDGPCGEPMVDIDSQRYRMALLISGGIGITPMQSVCSELLDQARRGRDLKKVWFVWAVRDVATIESLDDQENPLPRRLPLSFQPDNLPRVTRSLSLNSTSMEMDELNAKEPLHTDFFLTRSKDKESELNRVDPELDLCLSWERPNIPQIMRRMRTYALKNSIKEVAVMVCGPQGMINDTKNAAAELSGSDFAFHIHFESFEF